MAAAAVPLRGVDPRVALASTLQTSATTAALLGSGISRAAGIKTGWEVAIDLVRRVARASGTQVEAAQAEEWWRSTYGTPLEYDNILPALAPTDATRRELLRSYFETDEQGNAFEPTEAHHALASLAAQRRLRVILTTNFDHLMENALRQAGVVPQVLVRPGDVAGMTPLQHANVTLVKLHGDYASGRLLNDPDELARYGKRWRRLLRRIFAEYGLVVIGWSAEYDRALERAMAKSVGRRYAWYWVAHRGELQPAAQRLVEEHQAHLITSSGADEFAGDLTQRVAGLDRRETRRRHPRPAIALAGIDGVSVPGWEEAPLVHARAAAAIPNLLEWPTLINARLRARILQTLTRTELTSLLQRLNSGHTPAQTSALNGPGRPGPVVTPTPEWALAEGQHQHSSRAVFAWGSRGGPGACGLVTVTAGDSLASELRVTVDVGLSFVDGVPDEVFVDVLHVALLTAAGDMAAAADGTLHDGEPVERLELHWQVPDGSAGMRRPVPPQHTVHLDRLGPHATAMEQRGGYAEVSSGDEITPDAAVQTVLRALERVALDIGLLDPDAGIEALRAHLMSAPAPVAQPAAGLQVEPV